ncbi:hypothetical protein AB0G35_17035 [Streptomyces sp. NPDC021749]
MTLTTSPRYAADPPRTTEDTTPEPAAPDAARATKPIETAKNRL